MKVIPVPVELSYKAVYSCPLTPLLPSSPAYVLKYILQNSSKKEDIGGGTVNIIFFQV